MTACPMMLWVQGESLTAARTAGMAVHEEMVGLRANAAREHPPITLMGLHTTARIMGSRASPATSEAGAKGRRRGVIRG